MSLQRAWKRISLSRQGKKIMDEDPKSMSPEQNQRRRQASTPRISFDGKAISYPSPSRQVIDSLAVEHHGLPD